MQVVKELEYPFDSANILKKKKSIRRQLLEDGTTRIRKNIAILGGSTTANVAHAGHANAFQGAHGHECGY